MKGIILAGGSGTRLYPMTKIISKQLLPLYDKPMIYYPLSTLMLSGIEEILIISTPHDLPYFRSLLGNGEQLGISILYAEQPEAKGIAQAFIIGEKFINKEPVCMILGDNIFYGMGLPGLIKDAIENNRGATIFGYTVKDPKRYGIAEFNQNMKVISIEEKPKIPKSDCAVVGLYIYDNKVSRISKEIKPSQRGELEITAVNNTYLMLGNISIKLLGRGTTWFDTGTPESMLQAANFIYTMQERQGLNIGCLEEVAWHMGYKELDKIKEDFLYANSDYGEYVRNLN